MLCYLQEMDIVIAPCRGFQSAEDTLGEYINSVLPVITFAISEAELSTLDMNELQEIKEKFALPIFFFKILNLGSELISPQNAETEKSSLFRQLLDLDYLSSNHCSCGAPSTDAKAQSMLVEQSDKIRLLSTFSKQVLQQRLVDAATILNIVHYRCLDIFINQAFDMQRDLQITPKRLEYTRKKENELYESLMSIANRKQEEMKDMIIETLNNMKEELLEDAANMEFKGKASHTIKNSDPQREFYFAFYIDSGNFLLRDFHVGLCKNVHILYFAFKCLPVK